MKRKDRFTKEKRSEVMSKIGTVDTDIEVKLKKVLRRKKIRYLKKKLPGSPDIILRDFRIAIFCDGDFWHGRRFKELAPKLDAYWKEKITKNIKRDKRCDKLLKEKGWTVLRFWGSDIMKKLEKCVMKIEREIGRISV